MKVQECKKRHSFKRTTQPLLLTDQARVQKKQSDKNKTSMKSKLDRPTLAPRLTAKRKKKNTKMTILSRKLTSQATQTKESKQTGTN